MHSLGKIWLRRLDDEVIVVGDQAVGKALPGAPFDFVAEIEKETLEVVVDAEDRFASIPAVEDVIHAAGEIWSVIASHSTHRRRSRVPGTCQVCARYVRSAPVRREVLVVLPI